MDEWTLNDLLECSVCLERLDTSSKVLPCQHTFCKKCLEEILSTHRELRCPECRILVGIRIDDLPPNVLLMRILEGMRNSGSRNGTSQDVEHRNKRAPISNASSVVNLPREKLVSNPPSVQQSACVTASPANSQFQLEFRLPTKPRTPSYARAVYDYLSNEPGDLSFKKGDIILLRRKIDNNWYHGESCGQVGAFPLSYVQILARLPCHIPQCKALYDFRMASDDEEGCLTFNKGDIITVYRRVDENWAEGELIDQIGIFPLAFVELNTMARALIKLSSNTEPGASKVAPPTPSTEDATPLIMANNAPAPRPIPKRSVTNVVCSVPVSATDTSSSSLTSPSSSSTTPTTSSSSTPSSPASPPHITPPPPPPNKRHSFGTVHQSNSQSKNNRHSAEILSSPNSCSQPQSLPLDLLSDHQATPLQRQNSQRHRRSASSEVAPLPGSQNHHMSLQLPASYVALYPYKPQKADELELKRGAVYTVTERCQDGWFKGTSAKSQKSGVFPGNYVAPAKSLPALQAQVRGLYRNSGNAGTARCSAPPLEPRSPISYTRPSPRHQAMPSGENSQHRNTTNQSNEHQSTAVVAPPNVSVQAVCPLTKNCDKNRDKKDKGVSLMRRLTSMKKSKSPPPSSYSMDNPVFEDSSSAPSQAVHVRSGSCPNQLISTSPAELAATHTHRLFSPGSHRAKHKDRPHISLRTSTDVGGGSGSNESIQHRKSHSMDTTSVAASDDSSVSVSGQSKTSQLAPPIRERFRCIVPYPPNSEYELELQLGDVIYVHKKRDDGWYKGTQPRTGRTGLFPASFVQSF